MLKLKNIRKVYVAGDDRVEALKGITLRFRKSEFVSVLGQSGCGKTTLLNIVGGLDQYTSGDLVINGKSTRFFTDRDWDTYRNHSVGFVFQSYNLIPHQSVLANVELALTISGVSRRERRRRAIAALERVGLGDQLHKKPNQMSGGQMQRVAIARAIVNDPEVLLADEPTGALDTATSVQIMDLLREIAKDRLVIMVTHNPDIAKEYSTRIIRLRDGMIISDTNPYSGEKPAEGESIEAFRARKKQEYKAASDKGKKKASMSFFTALSLSFKNLMTKKTRTMLTAFAGSIGIIGIALILSVSEGVRGYINKVQEDTLSSYPITINKENADLTGLVTTLMGVKEDNAIRDLDRVYENSVIFEMMNSLTSVEIDENNLADFKKFLDTDKEIRSYISAVQYSYGDGITVYTRDENGEIYRSELAALMEMASSMSGMGNMNMGGTTGNNAMMFDSFGVWEEMLAGEDGALVNDLLQEQYDVVYGNWPTSYNEIVLIVNGDNEVSDMALYALGLKSADDFEEAMKQFIMGTESEVEERSWTYEEICAHTYKLILNADLYHPDGKGGYVDVSATQQGLEYLYNNDAYSTELKVVGIVRKNPDAVAGMLNGAIGYTSELTQYMIRETANSEIVKAQLADPETDIFTGLPFRPVELPELSDSEKEAAVLAYFETLSVKEKADVYTAIATTPSQEYLDAMLAQVLTTTPREQLIDMLVAAYVEEMGGGDADQIRSYISAMSEEEFNEMMKTTLTPMLAEQYKAQVEASLAAFTDAEKAAMLATVTSPQLVMFYDSDAMPSAYSDAVYEDNLELLYYIDGESPTKISIYAEKFEYKDKIAECIAKYNETVDEEDEISYTDYVALLMSSISTVIDAISYVLIAFVAISLIVSSIMIAIITYISVLERTKEIGVLRAIGASKGDVSRVFNAETLIEGFVSGILGISVTLLLIIPINLIIQSMSGISALAATLPGLAAVILVVISMVLTLFAGLVPSVLASRKDPVVALRSE